MSNQWIAVGLMVVAACGNKSGDGQGSSGGSKEERPAPFEAKVNKVEKLESVATNPTYAAQGLGKKAPDGKVFVCVQWTLTSKSDQPETYPGPTLSDGKGATLSLSTTAAGNYMPEDWHYDSVPAKAEPGKAYKQTDCFEVAKDATTGMKLQVVDTGWGPKFKPWHLSVAL